SASVHTSRSTSVSPSPGRTAVTVPRAVTTEFRRFGRRNWHATATMRPSSPSQSRSRLCRYAHCRFPMPKALGKPAAWPPASSMWMSTNSSLTAAYRFQLWKPVVRVNVGISRPGWRSVAFISVPDQRRDGALHDLVALVGPRRLHVGEQHPAQPAVTLVVACQPGHGRDPVAGAHPHAVVGPQPPVQLEREARPGHAETGLGDVRIVAALAPRYAGWLGRHPREGVEVLGRHDASERRRGG